MTRTGRSIVQFLLYPLIWTFFLVYILYFEYLRGISFLFINIAPAIIFFLGGIVSFDENRRLVARKKFHGELEQSITITKYDIYYVRIVMYASFILIILLPTIFKQGTDLVDWMQALIGFFCIFWIRRKYFHFSYYKQTNGEYYLDDSIIITAIDTMKLDALSFFGSIALVGIPGVILRQLNILDIFQAAILFLAIYLINVKYFRFYT